MKKWIEIDVHTFLDVGLADGRTVEDVVNEEIAAISKDIADRPHVSAARKVIFTLEIVPHDADRSAGGKVQIWPGMSSTVTSRAPARKMPKIVGTASGGKVFVKVGDGQDQEDMFPEELEPENSETEKETG